MILGFSPEFNQAIKEGWKKQTIRRWNEKRRFYPGQELQFYNHVRQKNMKKFGTAIVVERIKFVWALDKEGHIQGYVFDGESKGYEKSILPFRGFKGFAQVDGFADWNEMKEWFEDRYSQEELEKPFVIIRWRCFEAV